MVGRKDIAVSTYWRLVPGVGDMFIMALGVGGDVDGDDRVEKAAQREMILTIKDKPFGELIIVMK